jgi:biotin carboxyl carrier protein
MSRHEFLLQGELIETTAEKNGEVYLVTSGEQNFEVIPFAPGLYSVMIDGRKKTIAAVIKNGTTYVDIDSVLIELKEPSDDSVGGGAGDQEGEKDKIFAPMPGKVVKLLVKVGDSVEPKQQAVIVEAMKMENPVLARAKGTVKAVNFKEGDQVDTDRPIIELELEEE